MSTVRMNDRYGGELDRITRLLVGIGALLGLLLATQAGGDSLIGTAATLVLIGVVITALGTAVTGWRGIEE